MARWLFPLCLMLCLVAAPLAAQSSGTDNQKSPAKEQHNIATPQVNILAPQLSEIDAATLNATGLTGTFKWHYGKVAGLGYFSTAGGREVVIVWDEGQASRMQGGLSDQQWEIFKLAFSGNGRIAILSDSDDWRFDYRFLEAQR